MGDIRYWEVCRFGSVFPYHNCGLTPAQDRVVPAPQATLRAVLWLRDEDGGMQEKPSKGAGGSARAPQPRGASLGQPGLLVGFFLFVFFPPTFMFTDSKDSKEVYFWLRPRC